MRELITPMTTAWAEVRAAAGFGEVGFDGLLADAHPLGDLLALEAAGEQLPSIELLGRQLGGLLLPRARGLQCPPAPGPGRWGR